MSLTRLLIVSIFGIGVVIGIAYLWLLKDLYMGRGCGGPQKVQCPAEYSCWQIHKSQGYGQCVYTRLWKYLPLLEDLHLIE